LTSWDGFDVEVLEETRILGRTEEDVTLQRSRSCTTTSSWFSSSEKFFQNRSIQAKPTAWVRSISLLTFLLIARYQ